MSTIVHPKETSSEEPIVITNESPNEKSNRNFEKSSMTNGVVKSRKKTSLKEFALTKRLRPEIKAGFKVWLRGDEFHFDKDWERLFYEYNHRR